MKKAGLFYWLMFYYVRFTHGFFYRRFEVRGKEYVNLQSPQIYGANHPNGLMDSLAIIFAVDRSVAWLARADIFQKSWLDKALRSLRMVPVYRQRDGAKNMSKNDVTFQEAVEIINAGIPLALFPEASQLGVNRLRPFKTGLARIAIMPTVSDELVIVPFGLNYSAYLGGYNDLLVNIGPPIKKSDYAQLDDTEKKYRITQDLKDAIDLLMINLPEDDYHVFHTALAIYTDVRLGSEYIENYDRQKVIADSFHSMTPARVASLRKKVNHYEKLCDEYDLECGRIFEKSPVSDLDIVLIILLSPFILIGWMMNFIPYRIAVNIARKPQDGHMFGTIMQGMYMLFFPIFYLFIIALILMLGGHWLWTIILPTAGVLSLIFVKKLERYLSYRRQKAIIRDRPELLEVLSRLCKDISGIVETHLESSKDI